MAQKPEILVIIPARGGSKGIPRKNLRTLCGKPLIAYAINTALNSNFNPDVFVSSDDDEILFTAEKLGARTISRESEFAKDTTTLDPVVYDAYKRVKEENRKNYQFVITLQPTTPLLKSSTLDDAIQKMIDNPETDTLISAINDTHLTWKKENEVFVPNYKERMNRQYLTPVYKETGGFLIAKSEAVKVDSRIGGCVDLFVLSGEEAIDVDTYDDWNLCEYYLKRKSILFVVSGYDEIGLGHVYNTLGIANEILNHEISFLVDSNSHLAHDKISMTNYPLFQQEQEKIIDDIRKISPDIVINDILDTKKEYMLQLKDAGYAVINFEDLGEGAAYADMVINAMYPETKKIPNHYYGQQYFCIKNEFYLADEKKIEDKVGRVLITFGGVDPNNLTLRTLSAIYEYCIENHILIDVLAGLGYNNYDSLKEFSKINIYKDVANVSGYMSRADIAFTSAGRTTFEIATIGVPTMVLAQNEREKTHFFATGENGFVNLGLGVEISREKLLQAFEDLVGDYTTRLELHQKLLGNEVKNGKKRVIGLINELINSL